MPRSDVRCCDGCGVVYYRRDFVEVWAERNPGHRTGWRKSRVRLCMRCSDTRASARVLTAARVRLVRGVPSHIRRHIAAR